VDGFKEWLAEQYPAASKTKQASIRRPPAAGGRGRDGGGGGAAALIEADGSLPQPGRQLGRRRPPQSTGRGAAATQCRTDQPGARAGGRPAPRRQPRPLGLEGGQLGKVAVKTLRGAAVRAARARVCLPMRPEFWAVVCVTRSCVRCPATALSRRRMLYSLEYSLVPGTRHLDIATDRVCYR
jgi:hypothetical protein